MTFEGKTKRFWRIIIEEWNKSYMELIALYVHPKNSNHLRSHLRAIMALDHSRLGLENKFLENKSGRIFLLSTSLLYKISPTNPGVSKPTFYTYYTSHLRWNSTSTIYHTDLGQNAVFHNFQDKLHSVNIQDDQLWAFSETVEKNFQNPASQFSLLTRAKFALNF